MLTTVIILALLTALVATDEHANATITPGEDYPDKSRCPIPRKPAAARFLRASR